MNNCSGTLSCNNRIVFCIVVGSVFMQTSSCLMWSLTVKRAPQWAEISLFVGLSYRITSKLCE